MLKLAKNQKMWSFKMELEVQKFLRSNHTLYDLTDELGILVTEHPNPNVPLVSLKYSQINSPKHNEIVKECRGLVLEKDTWNVVAKPFKRFFNLGEDINAEGEFD